VSNLPSSWPDLSAIRTAARLLIAKGLAPIPLPPRDGELTKKPAAEDWPNLALAIEQVDGAFHDGCNLGLKLDVLTDVDLDCPESLELAKCFLKPTACCFGHKSKRNSHLLYRVEGSRSTKFLDDVTDTTKTQMLVEIRHGAGFQTMVPPSVHPSGEPVAWEGSANGQPEVWDHKSLLKAVGKIAAGSLLIRQLQTGTKIKSRHDIWLYLGGAMVRAGWTIDEALFFVNAVTRAGGDEKPENSRRAVESSFEKKEEGEQTLAGLKKLEEYLDRGVVRKLAQWLELRHAKVDTLDLSDDANAQSLFAEHGEDLRFLPNEGKGGLWVFWNEVIWQRDRLNYVTHLAALALKRKANQMTAGSRESRFIAKVRNELLNMPGIAGAMNRLSTFPEIAARSDTFDTNPWLVGLQNGIYNLELDRLENGAREHLVSRQIPAAYDPTATCPRWRTCLERAQPEADVRAFLQRLAGACLLGMQTEHGFIFNYGQGANFKTAYSEVIRRVMGSDYAATPNEDLFFKGNQEVPRNYVADIHGMRLLTTNEKSDGSEWNIEFIKKLLGGQELNACRKYCEAFSFVPSARIIVAANNKPRLNELDEALRRRFLLVTWDVTIPTDGEQLASTETNQETILRCLKKGSRIPFEQLMSLLLSERDGILGWMLTGARDFIKRGKRLEPPASVSSATEDYFADEDIMGRFVKDWCSVLQVPARPSEPEIVKWISQKGTRDGALHEAFTFWAAFGKYPWSKSKVSRRLAKVKDVVSRRGQGNRLVFNLVLVEAAKEAMAANRARDAEPDLF
jgi:P4 family phage/plasmid primase-like protien